MYFNTFLWVFETRAPGRVARRGFCLPWTFQYIFLVLFYYAPPQIQCLWMPMIWNTCIQIHLKNIFLQHCRSRYRLWYFIDVLLRENDYGLIFDLKTVQRPTTSWQGDSCMAKFAMRTSYAVRVFNGFLYRPIVRDKREPWRVKLLLWVIRNPAIPFVWFNLTAG